MEASSIYQAILGARPINLFIVGIGPGPCRAVISAAQGCSCPGIQFITIPDPEATPAPIVATPELLRPDTMGYRHIRAIYNARRPALLAGIRERIDGFLDRYDSRGTVVLYLADVSTPEGAVFLLELPTDVNSIFFRKTDSCPVTLRLGLFDGDAPDPKYLFLRGLDDYYFSRHSFAIARQTGFRGEMLFANDYDSTVIVNDPAEVAPFLEGLVRLQSSEYEVSEDEEDEETTAQEPKSPEEALRRIYKLFWYGLIRHSFFPRVWERGLPALLRFLDISRDGNPHFSMSKPPEELLRESGLDSEVYIQVATRVAEAPTREAEEYFLRPEDTPNRITVGDVESQIELGRFYLEMDSPRMAAREFQRAARGCPDPAQASEYRGLAWCARSDYRKALTCFQRALRHSLEMPHSWEGLLLAYHRLGETDLLSETLKAARARRIPIGREVMKELLED